jgi:dimethylamine monooxygenase subunit C
MPKTTFPPSIRSRPSYGEWHLRPGAACLMVADGAGAGAVIDLAAVAPGLMDTAHVIYVTGRDGAGWAEKLATLKPAVFYASPTYAAAVPRLRKVLADAKMGLQVYLAGTEGLIGQAQNEAMAASIPFTAIQTEHRGSLARRVQCVHCKGITEEVRTDPFQCSHCGLHLYVRDHYSRRIAAFQGVNIDAETPGIVPAAVERFP